MNSELIELAFVSADDWIGLYIDCELVYEGHSIETSHLLDLLLNKTFNQYSIIIPDQEWLEQIGNLPKNVADIKRAKRI